MPFTTNRGYSVQAAGTNAGTWGAGSSDALNEGVIEIIDNNLGGTTSKSLSSSNVLLTQSEAQNGMLRLTGTLLANVQVAPDAGVLMVGLYCFSNTTSGSFTVTFANSAGSVVLPQARRGLLWIDTTNGPQILGIAGSGTADPIPAASSMPFYNTSVPSGWTAVALNDRSIRLVNNGSGGSTGGSVPFSTLFGRTATDGYTLTVSDIPSHTHTYSKSSAVAGAVSGSAFNANIGSTTEETQPTGGGNSHSHNIDMRVTYAQMVIGTRD